MERGDEQHVVVVGVDRQRVGFMASEVREAVAAVAITPLPGAAPVVEGVIDLRGSVVPVIGLRRRLGLPERELRPADRLLVLSRPGRPLAVRVDAAVDVISLDGAAVDASPSAAPHLRGVVRLPDGLLLVCDVDAFLSPEEERSIAAALTTGGTGS